MEQHQEEMKFCIQMGQVPDILKMLPEFDGNPKLLNIWVEDVDGIHNYYSAFANCPTQFEIIERTVRRKIIGAASDALYASNAEFDWSAIKEVLVKKFSDRRDLMSLDYELTTIKRKNYENIELYFGRVNELLTFITNHIQNNVKYISPNNAFLDYFKDKAEDIFIRGLNSDLGILVKTAAPDSMNKAYELCVELEKLRKGTVDAVNRQFRCKSLLARVTR